MRFQVAYTVSYKRVIEAPDIADAARRMAAFRGTRPEGDIKLLSIVDMRTLPGIEEAVLSGQHKNGLDGVPV